MVFSPPKRRNIVAETLSPKSVHYYSEFSLRNKQIIQEVSKTIYSPSKCFPVWVPTFLGNILKVVGARSRAGECRKSSLYDTVTHNGIYLRGKYLRGREQNVEISLYREMWLSPASLTEPNERLTPTA